MRKGEVRVHGIPAGVLEETDRGFRFSYDPEYARNAEYPAVSLTLPKRIDEPYEAKSLFPFFAGLLSEGAAMELQCRLLHIDERDLFGRLLKTAQDDVPGNVTVHEITEGTGQ
ncbi:MAG: phosphatidylinositol kinase [Spartobacteria bacterium]|nr:phosphatidylinositol kinase [Spartobacteria bacterium]